MLRAAHAPDLADAPRRLARILRDDPHEDATPLAFESLLPEAPFRRVAAVDGSHATLLEGGAFLVGAYRAGHVLVEDGVPRAAEPPRTRVVVLEKKRAGEAVNEALKALGSAPAAPVDREPAGALEDLRVLAEAHAALDAVAVLDAGDALLLDGAFEAHSPTPPRDLLQRILAAADGRGVAVVAVAKSTSLLVDGAPALHVAKRRARRDALHATWAARLPAPRVELARVYAARLNPAQERLFRFDVAHAVGGPFDTGANGDGGEGAPAPGADPADVAAQEAADILTLARLAPLANHPGYPGYPVPLALAHNHVAMKEHEEEDLAYAVRRAAIREGVRPDTWDAFFEDFHEELDRGA